MGSGSTILLSVVGLLLDRYIAHMPILQSKMSCHVFHHSLANIMILRRCLALRHAGHSDHAIAAGLDAAVIGHTTATGQLVNGKPVRRSRKPKCQRTPRLSHLAAVAWPRLLQSVKCI